MIIVQDKLVSDDVVEENFICNLSACKGACCWEGDFGDHLEENEMATLEAIYEDVKPFLSPAGIAAIEANGKHAWYDGMGHGTMLIDGGPCAFLTFDGNGVAWCGIEKAWHAGATDFKKPISCHLYPIRIMPYDAIGTEAINYDRWDICSEACKLGDKEKVPVYKFLKEALIRKYGEEFYEELDGAAEFMKAQKSI